MADWGEIASKLANLAFQDTNKEIIANLKVDGAILDRIQENFVNIADQLRIKVHSFQGVKVSQA